MSLDGFYRAPRLVRMLLEDGVITPTDHSLWHYALEREADRPEGFATTLDTLRVLFGVSDSTLRRSLRRLRELGLLRYDLRQGQRRPFRIWVDLDRLLSPETEVVTEVVTEVTSVRTSVTDNGPESSDPGRHAGSSVETTSARLRSPSRARAQTETETETEERSLPTVENALGAAADAAGSERVAGQHRELLRALVRTLGDPNDWGEYAAAATGLLEQHVRPDELATIVQAHRARFPDADVTASSVEKWAPVLRELVPA